ncbi:MULTISPECIES: hypothetical protein [Streptomyces]|uniref:Phage integrase family domain-containing protein n=1 Tax=Streptomyces albus (strain ATCC 21838 / DSM 41398 / FERM P-419 / JCM 4703 / NBRC 107858) TaxID=1081613 RepID=A0A0B5ERT1_STRA4|nr:phage integrase family domain-containing protein [Streptomyces albus]AOU76323.1 phage integrase family domain-containing protein [Streptomyces albus]AYN32108.1 hypothetical protein DUI70_1605 [Streptomyces albus]
MTTLATITVAEPRFAPDLLVLRNRPLRPGVSLQDTARFGDEVWKLKPAIVQDHHRELILNFPKIPGCFRQVAKELMACELAYDLPPGERPARIFTLRGHFADLRMFLEWAAKRGATRLADLTPGDLADYLTHLGTLRIALDTRRTKTFVARKLWLFRTKLSDALAFDPAVIPGWVRPKHRKDGENTTERIPEQVIGPLLTWALRWIEDFSDDIMRAHDEYLDLRHNTVNNRIRRGAPRIKGAPAYLATVLDRYRAQGQPLPGAHGCPSQRTDDWVVNTSHLARQVGCNRGAFNTDTCRAMIADALRELGLDHGTYLLTQIEGRLDGRPWRGRIAYEEVQRLDRLLAAACYIVVAYLSGMRDSEVKHLARDCLSTAADEHGRTYRRRITSLAFKGEQDVRGVEAQWIVGEPVERAIRIMERLAQPDHQRLFSVLASSPHYSRTDPNRSKTSTQTIADLRAFMDWINDYCTAHGRGDFIPPVNGRRWPITTRQFRRTLAWFIARRPGGTIAGAIQYRHLSVQMFEGYAGTSESGFRPEVEAEQALARGEQLLDLVGTGEHHRLTGPAAEEAELRLAEFAHHADFRGKVVTDPVRLKRLMTRQDPHIYPGGFVTCVHVPERALCRRGDDTEGPSLPDCQPLRCRNVALNADNREALATHLRHLDTALAGGDALAPFPRQRMQHQHDEIAAFLARHTPDQEAP